MIYLPTWIISFLAIAGVIIRPFKVTEAVYAVTGAILLLLLQQINYHEAVAGMAKGIDVYLFLTGMMLLAETARAEKLFDWLAAHATLMAKGSPSRLFLLIYLVGIAVTTLLSNDAAAVVLTPAVAAAVSAAKVEKPLPYLLICAFIANAASFVLPISNPANLVIYGSHMPSLYQWLSTYLIPSICAITVTYLVLYFTQRSAFSHQIRTDIQLPKLSSGGRTALLGIGMTAIVLLVASGLNMDLGLPTAITGILTTIIVMINVKKSPVTVIKGVSWAVLPLVAGLFVIVEALNKTGMIQNLTALLNKGIAESATGAVWLSGIFTAFACNLMNNLPAGLIAGNVLNQGHSPEMVKSAVLIGIDLGPNLSITGSLATILWLVALRREGLDVSAWKFLKLGALVMTLALIAALASLWI
ncbi:arsenite efflux membrane protein ArsB [Pedobacter psychrotolerans]|uniref:Arsenic transporter n=1 Tax=Pedobacter psychrotolerans TaxID=1843235 RepID=A0A4R2HQP5_9SPHI|nr:arsenic transporter [Pedobacter psychrotolerans]TCO31181.1 arsenite efflux membrane protein ArsB [Pedobacter psychrotolerans]GGE41665.1 arsenic transporter [Pedobacter psychrotolerans]